MLAIIFLLNSWLYVIHSHLNPQLAFNILEDAGQRLIKDSFFTKKLIIWHYEQVLPGYLICTQRTASKDTFFFQNCRHSLHIYVINPMIQSKHILQRAKTRQSLFSSLQLTSYKKYETIFYISLILCSHFTCD
jgi:hypothetical protein